jgi:hypothetical protein
VSCSARPHIPEDELHAYCDEQLSPAQRAEIATHLLGCLICRAQHAEVLELRARVSTLFALATPPQIARPMARPRRTAWLPRRGATVAAMATIAAGVWLALQPAPANAPAPRLATAFVAPPILARSNLADSMRRLEEDAARSAALFSRAVTRPRVVAPMITAAAIHETVSRATRPVEDVDPAIGPGWQTASWDSALTAGHGALARLEGLPVHDVRILPASDGGRPSFIVHHVLPDGRAVWVIEGTVEDIVPVHQLLEASGLSMSIPLRARPDYIGSDAAPSRTVRMVSVAAYLPTDSLDALVQHLRER